MNRFSITEFSRMCGLPVKTLRFYHEKQLLNPAYVDRDTGYRYYDKHNLERAQVIKTLRALDFGLATIAEILVDHEDDADILEFLENHRFQLQDQIQKRADIVQVLETIISRETNARKIMTSEIYKIEEKQLSPTLVGGMRMQGRYSDCGKAFGKLGRKLGRHIGGKAMMLCYDDEYREEDADFEPCMPLKRALNADDVDVRELPGGPCVALIHHGSYDSLSHSYARLIEYLKDKNLVPLRPTREVYLKGPGMIFKGNPAKYLTEIQLPVEPA
ncbi:MAG: DNA-binding transcriptional MerR regulator/DNA gyrase inhibitor GyrI [Planctomycetota bacterium]|jgi:DNA-binding transcriptional MerR regulator/DNA gyrase inhibitor GyrI